MRDPGTLQQNREQWMQCLDRSHVTVELVSTRRETWASSIQSKPGLFAGVLFAGRRGFGVFYDLFSRERDVRPTSISGFIFELGRYVDKLGNLIYPRTRYRTRQNSYLGVDAVSLRRCCG